MAAHVFTSIPLYDTRRDKIQQTRGSVGSEVQPRMHTRHVLGKLHHRYVASEVTLNLGIRSRLEVPLQRHFSAHPDA